MKPVFYAAPIIFPPLHSVEDPKTRGEIEQFCRRAVELRRAASLIDHTEPGLLTAADRDAARRRGLAAGKRILIDAPKGKPKIIYYRTLSGDGLHAAPDTLTAIAADRIWLLEDRCGLADNYLRAVSDMALQNSAECLLCPSPMRQDRLEAVFLPGCKAAFLSINALEPSGHIIGRRVHLDRIPDTERKQALRQVINENKKWIEALTDRAASQLKNAEILCKLSASTCVDPKLRL